MMKRFLALLLAAMMLCGNVLPGALLRALPSALAETVTTDLSPRDEFEVRNPDAMHFIVRHWHTCEEDMDNLNYQGDALDTSGDRYFVVCEGYIAPAGSGYKFYIVDQGTGEVKPVDDTDGLENDSDYVAAISETNGYITLTSKPLAKTSSSPGEIFSDFSVSAGHSAVTYEGNNIKITYDKYVHLVKAHAFYVKEADAVGINSDAQVLGQYGPVLAQNAEQDTVVVPPTNGIKYYDTSEGLHTDKTATAVEDDTSYVDNGELATRTFNLDLEAWYSEGYPPQVGMVLDASGSMAFASDTPTEIKLTDAELAALPGPERKKLSDSKYPMYSTEWDDYFLTPEQVDVILNKRNTDNSRLSASGYSYFVLVEGSGYNPLGYWEGVPGGPAALLSFNNGNYGSGIPDLRDWLLDSATLGHAKKVKRVNPSDGYLFEEMEIKTTNGRRDWPNDGFKFSASTGYNAGYSDGGILLDVVPEGDFTLTFDTQIGESPNDAVCEMLYIGPMKGDADTSYLRFYRDTQGNLVVQNPPKGSGNLIGDNQALKAGSRTTFTLAYSAANGRLTVYAGNAPIGGIENVASAGFNIILNGFADTYGDTGASNDSKKAVWMDEVTLYDSVLTPEQVTSRKNATPPDVAKTGDGKKVLGDINRSGSDASTGKDANLDHTRAGWYYVTHAGAFNNHYIYNDKVDLRTGKRLLGIDGAKRDNNWKGTDVDYGHTYLSNLNTPALFYVNNEGNLCCFYNTTAESSYVYELSDTQYIRTEALQRALGAFVTQLSENSSNARVSAVRFSTADIADTNLDKLVLLDWTNDAGESADILSLTRGDGPEMGMSTGSTTSLKGLEQYNYGLTGSTSTWRGLLSYIQNLKPNDNPYQDQGVKDEDVPKYLIIFTDGKDTGMNETGQVQLKTSDGKLNKSEAKSQAAKTLADYLKDVGYTIYTVLLDGSAMKDDEYTDAENFLLELAGKEKGASREENRSYFFSVNTARVDMRKNTQAEMTKNGASQAEIDAALDAIDAMNDADVLTQIFSDEILHRITDPLESYTVKDYIDPRFDLVDADGTVWHLDAHGNVSKVSADGVMLLDYVDTDAGAPITLPDPTDDGAKNPYLRYDDSKDMYYLEWVEQTIPASTVDAARLPVWNARVTIRAKDDFIGGNAVLSNGNNEHMNYVYNPGTSTAFAGAGNTGDNAASNAAHTKRIKDNVTGKITELPSKGFPRTSVNVTPPRKDVELEQTIFMGEDLNKDGIAKMIIEAAKQQSETTGAHYYWEYVGRFVNYFNQLKKDGDPDGIIDRLHKLNRDGRDISDLPGDSLADGEMKIISNRIYDLINSGELSIENLSKLLISGDTVLVEGGGENGDTAPTETHERYLYIPYIYLPDDPIKANATNATGNGEYQWDVLGYLFFHVDDVQGDDGYPEGGITTDTKTRVSQLTVSFLAHSAADRAKWNNSQAIQELKPGTNKNDPNAIVDPDNKVYKRDTAYKPAPGKAINRNIVIKGEFTTHIVSGEIALQVVLTDEAVSALRRINRTFTYTADLYWTHETHTEGNPVKVGTLTATISPYNFVPGTNLINASVNYNPEYDYSRSTEDEVNWETYALPLGKYTLKNERGENVPAGFSFGELELIRDENEYNSRQFAKGTDFMMPKPYVASDDGDLTFLLSNDRQDTWQKPYTDFRFGLYRVMLDATGVDIVPQTGDNSHIALWSALMLMAIASMAACAFATKKKKTV